MAETNGNAQALATNGSAPNSCTAFEGSTRLASGDVKDVALIAKAAIDRGSSLPILIFDDRTGAVIDIDFRGTSSDVANRLEQPIAPGRGDDPAAAPELRRGPGRPRLGVVAREVTLLPRHWDWLNDQPGGASVALRKLVEEARRTNAGRDRVRRAQDAGYRFMSAMAGNEPGFEEAMRALFAGNRERFDECVAAWPPDVRDQTKKLTVSAFPSE